LLVFIYFLFRNNQLLKNSFYFFCLILLTNSLYTYATNNTDELRKLYLKADKLVWKENTKDYQLIYNQLNHYALQPYLDQKRLLHQINLKDKDEITTFLTQYKGTPLDWPLRKKWLKYLARRKQKSLFLKFYRPNSSAELTCQFYQFQLDMGMPEQVVLPQVTKLWLVGKSQPKVCDPLFKRWQKAGYRSEEIIWQRIKLAAQGGKHTLIPYLTKLLPKSQRPLAKLWHKVRRNPAYITKLSRFKNKNAQEAEIMTYGLKRLIWRSPNKALQTYKKAQKQFTFSTQQQSAITKKFALALASKHHKQASYWLDKVADEDLSDDIVQWRLAEVLKNQNWFEIIQVLNHLPQKYRHKLQWKYWYARSLIEQGDKERGKLLLNLLANERHYYGFMAASYLDKAINIQHNPLDFSTVEKKAIMQHSSAQRSFELFYLKKFEQARREWSYWLSKLNKKQKLIAASIAYEKDWFDRSIFTLAKQGYLDDVNLRFPEAFAEEIRHFSKHEKIDPSWVFAIARRESSFMVDAHSGAGAVGLMQILPSTAKQLLREKNFSRRHLFNAKNNIRLGTKYLKKLLIKQDYNFILATASYNAGPYRVNAWLKNKTKLPADIWIETIPYKETREYVKSVLAYQQIYMYRRLQSNSLFDQVITMEIGE